jgi:hypothetical protein
MVEGDVPNAFAASTNEPFSLAEAKKHSVRNLSIVDYRYFRVLMEVNFVHF